MGAGGQGTAAGYSKARSKERRGAEHDGGTAVAGVSARRPLLLGWRLWGGGGAGHGGGTAQAAMQLLMYGPKKLYKCLQFVFIIKKNGGGTAQAATGSAGGGAAAD